MCPPPPKIKSWLCSLFKIIILLVFPTDFNLNSPAQHDKDYNPNTLFNSKIFQISIAIYLFTHLINTINLSASSSLKRNRTPTSKKDSKTKQKDANANNISGSQFRWVKTLFTLPLPLRNRLSARSSSVKKPNEDDERTPLISNTNGGPIVLNAEKAVDGTVAIDNWQLRIENISVIFHF